MNQTNKKTLTVLSDITSEVEVLWEESKPLINQNDIEKIIGWELKTEGLCKGEICVPFASPVDHVESDFVDLLKITETLGFSTILDSESDFLAIDTFSSLRHSALSDKKAPDIKLPDLDGNVRFLSEWSDKKKLLVAFSSW